MQLSSIDDQLSWCYITNQLEIDTSITIPIYPHLHLLYESYVTMLSPESICKHFTKAIMEFYSEDTNPL